ncbi:hypothetical protein DMUE_0426 [Dictyocoela muelleri]|nr:hypothetical protein DMUE_0426 [Dictyocoela muelleri]
MLFILSAFCIKTELVIKPREKLTFYETLVDNDLALSISLQTVSNGRVAYAIMTPTQRTRKLELVEKNIVKKQFSGKGTYTLELTNPDPEPVHLYLLVIAEKPQDVNEDALYIKDVVSKMSAVLQRIYKLNSQMADAKHDYIRQALTQQRIFILLCLFNVSYIFIGIWKNKKMKSLVTPKK